MSPSLVRRFVRNAQGQLEEVGVVEGPAASAGDDGFVGNQPDPVMNPNGTLAPRYRAYRPQVTPPPPSRQYRNDPNYATGGTLSVLGETIARAHANQRAWHDHYSDATNGVHAWLAVEGCLGPAAQAAYQVYRRAGHVKAEARAAVVAAREAVTAAEHGRVDAINAYLEGQGPMPDGVEVGVARQKVAAVEQVVELVVEGANQAHQRWAKQLQRVDWTATLRQAEQLKGPQAERATAWVRVKLNPPPSSRVDPIGWAGT